MNKYNWRSVWWFEGLSLLAFAHRFARVNSVTAAELFKFLRVNGPSGTRKSGELIDQNSSNLKMRLIAQDLDISQSNTDRLFAGNCRVSSVDCEISRKLRYCTECLKCGLHFSWQQLIWLENCPMHDTRLRDMCECGQSIRYYLNSKHLNLRTLCSCGKLNFFEELELSNDQIYLLNIFNHRLQILQSDLSQEFKFACANYDDHSPGEVKAAYRLLHNYIRALIEPGGGLIAHACLDNMSIDHESGVQIDTVMNEMFSATYKAINADRRYKDQLVEAGLVVAELQRAWSGGLLERKIADVIHLSDSSSLKHEDLTKLITLVFVKKTLQGTLRGKLPVNRQYEVSNLVAARLQAKPLCLIIPLHHDSTTYRAYWQPDNNYVEESLFGWINRLCRFLIVNCYLGSSCKSKCERWLDTKELGFKEIFSTIEASWAQSDQQMDLFKEVANVPQTRLQG